MNSGDKVRATFLIWISFALASMFTLAGHDLNVVALFIALIYTLAALLATHVVVDSKETEDQPAKAKHSRIDRLLSSLSDDELDALRDRLSPDDGEFVSLDEVLRRRKN